jgi:hypothetical protein
MKSAVRWLFVVISVSSCSPDPTSVQLRFEELGCANPWGASTETKAIREYLHTEGVRAFAVRRKRTATADMLFCLACSCINGWTVFINVSEEDEAKARALGFY